VRSKELTGFLDFTAYYFRWIYVPCAEKALARSEKMMTQQKQTISTDVTSARRTSAFEEASLIVMIILSLVGVAVTDFSPDDGYWYWMIMIIVFGVIAVITGFVEAKKSDQHLVKKILVVQVIHWLGSMITVIGVLLLINAGRLNAENSAFVILLILALTTFLDGIRLGWRFSIAGVFLGVTAIIAAYIEEFLWAVLILAVALIAATLYWGRRGSPAQLS